MADESGETMAAQYDWILQAIEAKKVELRQKYPEAVHDTTKTTFKRIVRILEDETLKYNQQPALKPKIETEVKPAVKAQKGDTFFDIQVYNSMSKGFKDWGFPAAKLLSWDNNLIAI